MDIVLSEQMLVEPGEEVLLLPATTRYEIPGGVTETSTERRVIFSPEIPGPRIEEARPEWEVLGELAARARPGARRPGALRRHRGDPRGDRARSCRSTRDRGAARAGGLVPVRRRRTCSRGWRVPDRGRPGALPAVPLPEPVADDGRLALSTRRGKQFNSMVQERSDSLTGAVREAVLISAEDAGAARDRRRRRGRRPLGDRRAARPGADRAARARQRPGPLARGQRADRRLAALARGGDPRLQRPGHGGAGGPRGSARPASRSAGELTLKAIRFGSP